MLFEILILCFSLAPTPQSDVIEDYDPYIQRNLLPGFNVEQQHFYSRGHLTPNSDFGTDEERKLTMINTNVAPQWQRFKSQNWVVVESAVTTYSKTRRLYVFTGTCKNGKAFNLSVRVWINFEQVLSHFPTLFYAIVNINYLFL